MIELLKKLCALDATSGDEKPVRDFIISQIAEFAEYSIDNLGNIIAFKKGKKAAAKKVMIDAHTDEVGLIINEITADGFLKVACIGGIDSATLMFRRVRINGKINGVIGGRPIHLLDSADSKKAVKTDKLYIDIGAKDAKEAEQYVKLGDRAVVCGDFHLCGDKIISKALDDRIGCAVLIKLLQQESEYDFYAIFSTQEEVGLRGARVAAYSVNPDAAIILEGTTAADIADVAKEKQVCNLSKGVAISFMDNATVYDRALYDAALKSSVNVQTKRAVAGGNNSGTIHTTRGGVRTIALSVPCRYIHSASSVADVNDINSQYELAKYMLCKIASGEA